MNAELEKLAEEYKKALNLRDGGAEARRLWIEIKKISTPSQQVKIIESTW